MSTERRVRPPAQYEDLIDDLTTEGVFESKQAVMMFAAALGKRFGERRELERPGEGVRWGIFENNGDDAFVKGLAVSHSQMVSVLDSDTSEEEDAESKDAITIFEEYVAGGFEYLQSHVVNAPGDTLDNCLALIQDARREHEEVPPELSGLSPDTLGLLGEKGE